MTEHERAALRAERMIESYRRYTHIVRDDMSDQDVLRRMLVDFAHLLWRTGYDFKAFSNDALESLSKELSE